MGKLSANEIKTMMDEYNQGIKTDTLIKKYNVSRGTFFNTVKKYKNQPSNYSDRRFFNQIKNNTYDDNEIDQINTEMNDDDNNSVASVKSNESLTDFIKKYNPKKDPVPEPAEEEEPPKPRIVDRQYESSPYEFKEIPEEEIEKQKIEKNDGKKEIEEKRKLIRQIKNYCKEFSDHLTYLIGTTQHQHKKYIDELPNKTLTELYVIRDEISYAISSKNSNNLLKIVYLQSMGVVENVGVNYLDLKLQGLQQTLANNRDIDMIMKELACMYNLNMFTDPRARLIMLTGMTILAVDGQNRLKEQHEEIVKIRDKMNKEINIPEVAVDEEADNSTQPSSKPSQNDDDDEELKRILDNIKI